jgi:hypothetical protein
MARRFGLPVFIVARILIPVLLETIPLAFGLALMAATVMASARGVGQGFARG